MISNLILFFLAILKAGFYCGFLPSLAIAILYECSGVRIVRVGFEKVSAGGQLASTENRWDASAFDRATSPPQKVRCA